MSPDTTVDSGDGPAGPPTGMSVLDRDAIEDLPTVSIDESQLNQVFQNLVSNVLKYSGDKPPRIRGSAERSDGEWVFSVTDNGIGIEPDQTDWVFDAFDRHHTRDEYPGTGIGLIVCQKIVDRHGGDTWVESDPGEGSTFYFTIPIGRSD